MRPVCVFAGVGSGEEDQKVGQAIIMAYHGGETERVEGDEAGFPRRSAEKATKNMEKRLKTNS